MPYGSHFCRGNNKVFTCRFSKPACQARCGKPRKGRTTDNHGGQMPIQQHHTHDKKYPAILSFKTLSHRFSDGHEGLSGIDLDIQTDDFLILAGRNGSGKTLLMRHAIGLARPHSGAVLFKDRPLPECLPEARRSIGLVFQDSESQIVGQSVEADVAFGPSNLGLTREEIQERSSRALALLGLSGFEKRRPDSLSGGERRRLAIAGVIAMGSELIILDEPFANLDLESIRLVLESLVALHATHRGIVVLTHELEKVLAHATRLAIMDQGRLAYDGSAEPVDTELFNRHGLANPFRHGLPLSALSWLE